MTPVMVLSVVGFYFFSAIMVGPIYLVHVKGPEAAGYSYVRWLLVSLFWPLGIPVEEYLRRKKSPK